MKILVLNSGSSSVKYSLFEDDAQIENGLIERVEDHNLAIATILEKVGVIDGVGHRVVHGGEHYKHSSIIDEQTKAQIKNLIKLAPLHNGANLAGIEAVEAIYPTIKQVAVFDTSFHQSIPKYAYMYALPYAFYKDDKIRRYGFHGTSHKYITKMAAKFLNKPIQNLNIISFHLGNGDSACAIKNGKSIDTTMGFTPLEGLIMGTRCGDIDPEILMFLETQKGLKTQEIEKILNKESGLKGICGVSDMRDVVSLANRGDERAQLAIDMFAYHAKKYLGAYMAVLGQIDAIAFTGGIGEHSAVIREKILQNLEYFGIVLDTHLNKIDQKETFLISQPSSKIKLLVVHTNEEKEIAEETRRLIC